MSQLSQDWSNLDVRLDALERVLWQANDALKKALLEFITIRSQCDDLWEKVKENDRGEDAED